MGEVAQNAGKSDELIYAAKVACELIPMPSMASLYIFLSKHKDVIKPLYYGAGRKKQRMLRESDILKIRSMLYTTEPITNRGRKKKPLNIIDAVIQRCQQA